MRVRGTVKWFNPEKGFGFIVRETGQDVAFPAYDKDEQRAEYARERYEQARHALANNTGIVCGQGGPVG